MNIYKQKYFKYNEKCAHMKRLIQDGGQPNLFGLFANKCTPEIKAEIIATLNDNVFNIDENTHGNRRVILESIRNDETIEKILRGVLSLHKEVNVRNPDFGKKLQKIIDYLSVCCADPNGKISADCKTTMKIPVKVIPEPIVKTCPADLKQKIIEALQKVHLMSTEYSDLSNAIKLSIDNNDDVNIIIGKIDALRSHLMAKKMTFSSKTKQREWVDRSFHEISNKLYEIIDNLAVCCKGDNNKLLPECKPVREIMPAISATSIEPKGIPVASEILSATSA